MKAAKAKNADGFERDRPDLPMEWTEVAEAAGLFGDGGTVRIEEQALRDVDLGKAKAKALEMEGCLVERVQFTGAEFGSIVAKDVRFVGCDLANVRAHRIVLVRVELIDCRLTGFRATALDWREVLVQTGDVRYAQMQRGRFQKCEFDRCNLQETDLQDADLAGSVVRSCDLGRADWRGAKLQGTDLRGSEVEGLLVGINDLQGAIVDAAQAMVFARVLGLEIR